MTRGRAWRRYRREVEKQRALAYYGAHAKRHPDRRPRLVGIYSQTPKICSCWCCGNPRRHFQSITQQERRQAGADLSFAHFRKTGTTHSLREAA